MKSMTIEQFSGQMDESLAASQLERIIVTRNGKPVAVVMGIEHRDAEDVAVGSDPEFWKLIAMRRNETTVALDDVKADLL